MGMMAELVRVISSSLEKLHGAPGAQVITKGKGLGAIDSQAEVYSPLGFFSRPPKGSRVVTIPLAGGRTRVVIAGANYQLNLSCTDGETIIYSTNAAGDTIKSKIYLDALGNIELNGNTKRLVTWDELNTAITSLLTSLNSHTHVVASIGAPTGPASASVPPITFACNITAAKTTTVKTGG